jgi:nitrate/nitrite transporter NarK
MMRVIVEADEEWDARTGRRALLCACLVGFAFSANYTNHAPLVPALTESFPFDLVLAGLLTTGIFLSHAVMQIPGGHLADHLGARPVVMAALALVCVGNSAIALATAYWQLLFWKVFVGFGTGACFVAGARYISGSFSGRRLNLAQGLYGGSVLLGSGFVIFGVSHFAAALGWRGAFLATAAVAAVAWGLWVIAAPASAVRPRAAGSFRGMLSDTQLWLLGVMQMASFGLVIVVSAWITTFLRRDLQLPPTQAGLLGSLALLLGIVVRPLGGEIVHRTGVRQLLQLSLLLNIAACLLLARAGGSLELAVIAIVALGLGCGLPYAALFVRASVLYPDRAGAAMGLVNMLGIVMILTAPPLIGLLAQWTGSFQAGFLALGAFALLAGAGTFAIKET